MQFFLRSFAAALLIVLGSAGCKKNAPPKIASPDKSAPVPVLTRTNLGFAASVDGVVLSHADFARQLDAVMAARAGQIPPAQQEAAKSYFSRRIVQGFVSKTLLLNEAKRQNIVVDESDRKKYMDNIEEMAKKQGMTAEEMIRKAPMGEQKAREEIAEGIRIEKLIDTQVRGKAKKVEDADVAAETSKREQERAAKIASVPKEIAAIREQLLAGTNFEAVARERSDCPSGKRSGGDLGTFTRNQMVKPFSDAAFSQKIGEIGPAVETSFGYHIIKVTAHTDAVPAKDGAPAKPETVQASHILLSVPPSVTRDGVRRELEAEQNKQLGAEVGAYIEKLQNAAKILTIFDRPDGVPGDAGSPKHP
jgi:peptidyl-prolyl cis-trans isomerase C